MKSALYLLVGVVAMGVTAADMAYASSFNDDLVSVCRYAADNNRLGLNRTVQGMTPGSYITAPTYRRLAKGLVCNGMSVGEFASYYGADKTSWMFQRHIDPTRKVIEIKDVYSRAQGGQGAPDVIDVAWNSQH